jgi:hypothetical protein
VYCVVFFVLLVLVLSFVCYGPTKQKTQHNTQNLGSGPTKQKTQHNTKNLGSRPTKQKTQHNTQNTGSRIVLCFLFCWS